MDVCLPFMSFTKIIQLLFSLKVSLAPLCRVVPLSKLYSIFVYPVAVTVRVTFPLVGVVGVCVTVRIVTHVVGTFSSQLFATSHLPGWLSEKVSLSVFGVALPLMMSAAFLLRV